MERNSFEIRQQAEELLKEAIKIWQESDISEELSGLENDPVFTLLLTTLTFQISRLDNDIEHLKNEIVRELSDILHPECISSAIPATVVISTNVQSGIGPVKMTQNSVFTLSDSKFQFIPILNTTVFPINIDSIVRRDGRRWQVSLRSSSFLSDLSGLSFAITNPNFKDLKLRINGSAVPLVKPWDYANLPLNKCFWMNFLSSSSALSYDATNLWFDLFARSNARLFCIKNCEQTRALLSEECDEFEFEFEFIGINDNFVFDRSSLILNTVPLANVNIHSVQLSASEPIKRIIGYNSTQEIETEQFLHISRYEGDYLLRERFVNVRKVGADRFNQSRLMKVTHYLLDKFTSDYYAFFSISKQNTDYLIQQIRSALKLLYQTCATKGDNNVTGTYLVLERDVIERNKSFSCYIDYITTNGAYVNNSFGDNPTFILPIGLNSAMTHLLMPPVLGLDEQNSDATLETKARYNLVTADRIVTPIDMKLFCYKELHMRYNISPEMVDNINYQFHLQDDNLNFGYEIWIDISIKNSTFVRRYFTDKIPQAEFFLEKMMEVRASTIYPFVVNIHISNEQPRN